MIYSFGIKRAGHHNFDLGFDIRAFLCLRTGIFHLRRRRFDSGHSGEPKYHHVTIILKGPVCTIILLNSTVLRCF
jgi:hypothetical protein